MWLYTSVSLSLSLSLSGDWSAKYNCLCGQDHQHQASTKPHLSFEGYFNIIEADREPHAPKATGERSIYICGKMFIYICGLGGSLKPRFLSSIWGSGTLKPRLCSYILIRKSTWFSRGKLRLRKVILSISGIRPRTCVRRVPRGVRKHRGVEKD